MTKKTYVVVCVGISMLVGCGTGQVPETQSTAQSSSSDFSIQQVQVPKTKILTFAQATRGTLRVSVSASSAGRLFVRYYENNVMKTNWYSFTRGKVFDIPLSTTIRNGYLYAEVYQGSVQLAYSTIPSTSSVSSATVTAAYHSQLRSRGATAVGDVKQESGMKYVTTTKNNIGGRAYLNDSGTQLISYVENPFLDRFVRDGGVQKYGRPQRDVTTVTSDLSYLTTVQGVYFYRRTTGQGVFFSSQIATVLLRSLGDIGAPLRVVGNILLAEKGLLHTSTQRAIPHTQFAYPVSNVRITQNFNNYYKTGNHTGMDIGVPTGTAVRAIGNGEVVSITPDRGSASWGNTVKVKHFAPLRNGRALYSQYAHLHTMSVRVGQIVQLGDILGTSGNTGFSTGPHLHLGLYDDRVTGLGAGYTSNLVHLGYIDPRAFLANPKSYLK